MQTNFENHLFYQKWAKMPLEIKDNEKIDDVFFSEAELCYTLYPKQVSQTVQLGRREQLGVIICRIVEVKLRLFLQIDNIYKTFESLLEDINFTEMAKKAQSTFKPLEDNVHKLKLADFCAQIELIKESDKEKYKFCLDVIGGKTKWRYLKDFAFAENLLSSCLLAIPRQEY